MTSQLYYLRSPREDEVDFQVLVYNEVILNLYEGQDPIRDATIQAFVGISDRGNYYESTNGNIVGYAFLNRDDIVDWTKGAIYQLAAEATKNDDAKPKIPALQVQLPSASGTRIETMIIDGTYYIPPSLGIMIESARMLIREVSRTCYGLSDEERMRALSIDPTDDTLRELEPSLWVALIRGGITRSEMLGTSSSTWRDPNIMRLQLSEGKKATAQFIRLAINIK